MSCTGQLPRILCLSLAVAAASGSLRAPAAVVTKADNDLPLTTPASWVGNLAPTSSDTALFDATLTGPLVTTLGGSLALSALKVTNPAGPITLGGPHALTVSTIDLAAATVPVTFNQTLVHNLVQTQAFSVASVLTLNGGFNVQTNFSGRGFTLTGGGTLVLGGVTNIQFPTTSYLTTVNAATLRLASPTSLNFGGNLLTLGSTASTFDLAGYNALTGGLAGPGTVTTSAAAPVSLTIRNDGTAVNTFSGTLRDGAGTLSLTKAGTGTERFFSQQVYSGDTTVARGTLHLDFSVAGAPAANILHPPSSLALAGGTLLQSGHAAYATAQAFASSTVMPGASSLVQAQSTASTAVATLHLGTLTRTAPGGTLNIVAPAQPALGEILTSTPAGADGTLGGWATFSNVTWTSRDEGTGRLVPLAEDAYSTTFAPGSHTNVAANVTAPADGATTGLRFNTPSATLTLAGANRIDSGGILIAPAAADAAVVAPTSADTLTSGNGADLLVHQHNTATPFTVAAAVVDNGPAPIALTKSGAGTLTLGGANTYSGGTFLNAGVVQLGAGATLGSGPVAITREPGRSGAQFVLPDGAAIPNAIAFHHDDQFFAAALVDVPAGAATLAGAVAAPAGPGNQYRLGSSGGTLTLLGQHTAGSPAPGSAAPFTTVFWGANRTNAASQPPSSRIIFAGTSSLTAYQTPITLCYADVVLQDNATITLLNAATANGLRMGQGAAFSNYQGGNILTLQDYAHLHLGDLNLDLNNNASFGANLLNLSGGSLTLGAFTRTNNNLPATIRFNGTTVVVGKESPAFLAGTSSSLLAIVTLGGARVDTAGRTATISLPLQRDNSLGASVDGGLTKSGPGTLTLASPDNTYTGPTVVTQGTLVFATSRNTPLGGLYGQGTVKVIADAAITSSAPVDLHTLQVDGTLVVSAGAGPGTTSVVRQMAIARVGTDHTGLFTMPNGALVVASGSDGEKLGKIADLQAALLAGYNAPAGGNWSGKGITIATAAFDPQRLTVGLFDNAILKLPSLQSTPLGEHDLLITVAPRGDANFDGRVDAFDLNALAAHWQQPSGATTSAGDFTFDGAVNAFDLNVLAANWQYGAASSAESFVVAMAALPGGIRTTDAAVIPEPASLLLLAPLALLNICIGRRRQISPQPFCG